jgi:hypothetical protein
VAFTDEDNQDGNNDKDIHLGGANDDGIIDGPTVLAHVELARRVSEFLIYPCHFVKFISDACNRTKA